MYAFAITAWCVVTGEQPFASMESAATTIPTAVDEGERPSLADGGDWKDRTTGQIAKIIEACWAGPSAERPAKPAPPEIAKTLDPVTLAPRASFVLCQAEACAIGKED